MSSPARSQPSADKGPQPCSPDAQSFDGLSARIAAAARAAAADGRSVHHVSLCAAEWPAGFPAITLKPALKAGRSVLWAMDAKGFKLVPYLVGATSHG